MTTEAPDRLWSGIDLTRILGGALAAVCAAVAGSFLGVAGTLVGAAVASVIGSVGTEIYSRSINKGTKKLQSTLAPTFIKAPAAVGTPPVEAATDEDSPSLSTSTAVVTPGADATAPGLSPTDAPPAKKTKLPPIPRKSASALAASGPSTPTTSGISTLWASMQFIHSCLTGKCSSLPMKRWTWTSVLALSKSLLPTTPTISSKANGTIWSSSTFSTMMAP